MKMKKVNLILWIVVVFLSLISSQSFSRDYVCIDPGHGGDDAGNVGRVYGLLEKNVNLGVGTQAHWWLLSYYWWSIMTRTEDVTMGWDERADVANKANYGEGVDAFVSIHHNADSNITDTITNGTETFWCNAVNTDSGWPRSDRTDTLATKVYYKLLDKFHYHPRGVKHKCWAVLRLTKMGSTLSEASFLSCAAVERQFYLYFDEECFKEGDAIARGTASYLEHSGITIVKNSYQGGNAGNLIVSKWDWFPDICFDTDTVTSPYTTCWLGGMFGETYCLEAITPQWIQGYQRTFHHWAHLDHLGNPDDFCYEPLWKLAVDWPEYDYHKYVAYFSGGPYSAQVVIPDGGQNWHPDEQRDIVWNASVGADSTTLVNIYLDRDGGNGGYPEHLAGSWPVEWGNHFTWTVTGPYSAHCRIKVVAEDVAGNSDEDVSNYDFSISETGNSNPLIDGHLQCKYPQDECNECIKYEGSFWLEIEAHDPDGDSIYYEWYTFSLPFPGHFGNGYDTMTTAENYVVYTAPAEPEAESPAEGGDADAKQQSVFLKVTVVDVRGGSNFITGYLGIYDPETSCLCGDVTDNSVVDIADVVFLVTYLYAEGPPPDPMETGDVNNDCVVNIADAVYIQNYLFGGGPPPECGWICLPDPKTPNSGSHDQTAGKVY
jgi:N-acetylmuramoyl-L-alanine amidase